MAVQLGKMSQIAISVHDMARAVSFYRDTLGLKFLFQAPNVAFFDVGGVWMMLGQAEPPDLKPVGSALYFDSVDIDGDYTKLIASGVRGLGAPHIVAPMQDKQLWMAFLSDPDGNTFALRQIR